MLNSLEIRNFKILKELNINSLGRINLFIGKNNTGKSTILEALSLYASKGDVNWIYQLLNERGENYKQLNTDKNETEANIKAVSSLFTNRQVSFVQQDSISIGLLHNSLLKKERPEKFISIRFVKYYDELISDNENAPNESFRRKRIIIDNNTEDLVNDYFIGLEIRRDNNVYILPLDKESSHKFMFRNILGNPENYQLIRTHSIDRIVNARLWDKITLSEKETHVIDALRIIEPNLEKINFIEQATGERTAVIKLTNSNTLLPLRSMGDGINRILTIILALVNADNGYLLIDEFENGLHHTVQKKLWEIVFNLSKALNVQVFATTHSEDCIHGFEKILNTPPNETAGKLIRLDLKNGVIRQVEYTASELKIAAEQDIETR